mmetsp:Transcript_2064/g.2720  ORF Transcript_2064/g.2720 Transcript_2064/m.2720 type:complete len:141 (-) Transcript_2064:431-853(-)
MQFQTHLPATRTNLRTYIQAPSSKITLLTKYNQNKSKYQTTMPIQTPTKEKSKIVVVMILKTFPVVTKEQKKQKSEKVLCSQVFHKNYQSGGCMKNTGAVLMSSNSFRCPTKFSPTSTVPSLPPKGPAIKVLSFETGIFS